jgi:Ca2+-binding EF-hand superfamily protein
MIEDKCYKAFIDFDREGNGGQINSDQVGQVLEQMEIKMSEQEMYKLIAEIDPENTGNINFSDLKTIVLDEAD